MKFLMAALLGLFSLSALSAGGDYGTNYNDDLDKNVTPKVLEEREEEIINTRDPVDTNYVPAQDEEREKEEQVESDVLQTDDPEKTYDPLDEEADE